MVQKIPAGMYSDDPYIFMKCMFNIVIKEVMWKMKYWWYSCQVLLYHFVNIFLYLEWYAFGIHNVFMFFTHLYFTNRMSRTFLCASLFLDNFLFTTFYFRVGCKANWKRFGSKIFPWIQRMKNKKKETFLLNSKMLLKIIRILYLRIHIIPKFIVLVKYLFKLIILIDIQVHYSDRFCWKTINYPIGRIYTIYIN